MKARLRSCGRSGLRRSSKILGQHCCAEHSIPAALVIRRARLGGQSILEWELRSRTCQLLHHMQRGPHIDEIELHALDSDLLSFRQIRNCSRQISVVDQLETAIAAALTGCGVRRVFRIGDKGLGCFRRRKLQKCNKGSIQRLPFKRLHVPAARQVLAAMFVHNVVHRSRLRPGRRRGHSGRFGA